MAKKSAEEIIKIVGSIKEYELELRHLTSNLSHFSKKLDRFEDTGLKWIDVIFENDNDREHLFDKDGDIDQIAKDAIIASYKKVYEDKVKRCEELVQIIEDLKKSLEE